MRVKKRREQEKLQKVKGRRPFVREMRKNWPYYLMMAPSAVLLFLFAYLPLPGIIIAFLDFNFVDKFRSPFVGLNNFKFYFSSSYAWQTTINTLIINLNYTFWTTLLAITVAIILNEMKGKVSKKIYQNAIFLPYFISDCKNRGIRPD